MNRKAINLLLKNAANEAERVRIRAAYSASRLEIEREVRTALEIDTKIHPAHEQ